MLRTLARLGPLPVTRLAKEAVLDRSTMGRNLDPLERRGFVAMTIGATDARERAAQLTPAGEAAIKTAMPHWRAAQKRVERLVSHNALANLGYKLRALESA